MKKITVIVPCFNEQDALPIYYKEMCRVMHKMPEVEIEMLFVDDGSTDATASIVQLFEDERISIICKKNVYLVIMAVHPPPEAR